MTNIITCFPNLRNKIQKIFKFKHKQTLILKDHHSLKQKYQSRARSLFESLELQDLSFFLV